jgi:preprotein translocase subunit YajC
MSPSSFASIFAQAANTAATAADASGAAGPQAPWWTSLIFPLLIMAMVYFALIRPQVNAKKQQEEKIRSARTGDKVIMSGGIHGLITNVKDTTVIVKIADNVKIEVEKTSIDKITRESESSEKPATAKA